MRLIPLLFILIALIMVAMGPAAASTPKSASSQAESGSYVTFVFDRDFPPYTYEENGTLLGFEVDLLRLLGEESGFRLISKPMVWSEAQLSFLRGEADVIGGMVRTEERQKLYRFTSHPHGTFDILTFVRVDSDIRSSGMLQGKRVAVQRGSIAEDLLNNQTGIHVQAYDSEGESLSALLSGDADAFVGGGSTTWFRIRQQNITGLEALAMPWEMHSIYFAVRDAELLLSLDRGMERLIGDGRYDRLYRKWFVTELAESDVMALVNASRQASLNAYAPYSRYTVGAAVLTASGRIYSGCNIENSLYGLSTSALKVALFKAISEGDGNIRAVANYLPDGRAAAPTGDERQILFEFGRGILVILGQQGDYTTKMVSEIFPYPFEMRM